MRIPNRSSPIFHKLGLKSKQLDLVDLASKLINLREVPSPTQKCVFAFGFGVFFGSAIYLDPITWRYQLGNLAEETKVFQRQLYQPTLSLSLSTLRKPQV